MAAAARPSLYKLVGAVDIDPKLVGRPLEDVLGVPAPADVAVSGSLDACTAEADAVIHSTSSKVAVVFDQLAACAKRKLNVVSSCEELFYPYLQSADQAAELDQVAKDNGVTLCGCGINPGFLMDVLPMVLSCVLGRVDHVYCHRVVDARRRRGPLQRKVGSGMTPEEFNQRADAGTIGHVGLVESIAYLAGELGMPIDSVVETLEPVVASELFETEHVTVQPGQVSGIDHQARAFVGQTEMIHLALKMGVGNADPHDRVVIRGEADIDFRSTPCVPGDSATAAVLVNLAGASLHAPPGVQLVDRVMRGIYANRLQIAWKR